MRILFLSLVVDFDFLHRSLGWAEGPEKEGSECPRSESCGRRQGLMTVGSYSC